MRPWLEYSPVEALGQCPGVVALLRVRSRRLARSGGSLFRVATGLDCCGARISLGSHPPHPPTMETGPGWGQAGQREGAAIAFANAGVWGVCEKPGDCTPQSPANRCSTKRWCLTGWPESSTGCAIFSPGWVFFSTGLFLRFSRAACLYLSFFIGKRERERELCREKAIHGFFQGLNTHSTGRGLNPRVFGGCFFEQNPMLARVCGVFGPNPRIHGLKCLYLPGSGSQ